MTISIETANGHRLAALHSMEVHGLPGVGDYALFLRFHGSGRTQEEEVFLRNLVARVYWARGGQRLLGFAMPEQHQSPRITRHTSDIKLGFFLPLTSAQMDGIEARRNGGDFSLAIWLTGEVVQGASVSEFQQYHEYPVKQQDWVNALEKMEYSRTLLYEVPLPELPEGTDAKTIIRKATEHLHQGRYDECVGECRKLLEAMPVSGSEKRLLDTARQKYKGKSDERQSMDVGERIAILRDALNHATHLAHHHTPGGSRYSRDQARLILGSAVMTLTLGER